MTCPLRPLALGTALFAACLLSTPEVRAQQSVIVGDSTIQNNQNEYPAPYGNFQNGGREQMLVLASELIAAGMDEGEISAVGMNVAFPSGSTLSGFTVSIGTTDADELVGAAWEGGLTEVFGPADFTDVEGWNMHTFSAPFLWDGESNIVVMTCFYNDFTGDNAIMNQSPTPFTSCVWRGTPNPNICTSGGGTHVPVEQRPDLQFIWTPLTIAPDAAFSQSTNSTCTGEVSFTDLSDHNPTEWLWDFGDGTTDTVQNPTHTYLADGVFIPQLIATNPYGSDTIIGTAITVSLSTPDPVPACIPNTTNSIAGLGILNVTINGSPWISADASVEGYADNTCQLHQVLQGTIVSLDVTTGDVLPHNVRAWADWDNSGTFTNNELVLTADNVTTASASIPVPLTAVLDVSLRLRVMADLNTSPFPSPCQDPQYGQAEDYAVMVLENTNPPEAIFSADPVFSCTGFVQFTDGSLNAPTSWQWDFGDSNNSVDQSPSHTYIASGTYTVTLTVTNAYGTDTQVATDLVIIDLNGQLLPAACTPNTQSYCCGYGILGVQFAGINSSSVDGSEGYTDRSCGNIATVTEGQNYPCAFSTGGGLDHDTRMWIDMNNDGSFTADEVVFQALGQQSPSGTASIPLGSVYGTPVRVRVQSDVVGQSSDACDLPLYGQTEDFSAVIEQNTNPPVAAFTADPTVTCTGTVQFTDLSTNITTSWFWDFGDSNTSTEQNPSHTYTATGLYTVTFTATNDFGSDEATVTNYITVLGPGLCDTLEVPVFNDQMATTCQGVLTDDGGPDEDYNGGTSGMMTIAPTDAAMVTLFFSEFEWGNNPSRWLAIYDGPDNNSPLIGQFNGNGLNNLPNFGVIISSGGSITLVQEQQGGGPAPNTPGFILTWDCSFTGIASAEASPTLQLWPQPADDRFTLSFGTEAGAHWTARIHNSMGATVMNERITGGSTAHTFDIAALAPGAYWLELDTEAAHWTRTLIIR